MSASESQISVLDDQERRVLHLNGPFGVAEAENLRQAAISLSTCERDVRVDWSEAAQVDVSVIQVLWALRKALAANGRSFSITPPAEAVLEYLRTAGLHSILDASDPA